MKDDEQIGDMNRMKFETSQTCAVNFIGFVKLTYVWASKCVASGQ